MTLPKLLLFSGCLVTSAASFAQRGIDGNRVVTTANTIVNEYTTLTANAAAGSTTITVAASGLNANNRFGAGNTLAAGDLIMIIQMQGVSANGSIVEYPAGSGTYYGIPNDNTWGNITNYNNCGRYEFAQVNSVPNTTTITLDCGLTNSYTSSGRTQVIRVPRYNTLTVTAPGSIIPQTWAAGGVYTGGVVAVETLGNTVINNTNGINASALGFRGGLSNENNSLIGGGQTAMQNSAEGAEKGEGVYGYQADYNPIGGRYCKGVAGNGGGGGDAHNGGGGGGSNAGTLAGWDGFGNPDASGAGWATAWNLESAGFATHVSPGGGRGGYTWAAASTGFGAVNRDATLLGPGNTSWGGDNRRNQGGLGGRPLDYTDGRLFMGGGGGAGDKNDNVGGNGGIGGGIVYLMCYGSVSGSGSVAANGGAGSNSGVDGAGGGGGGGVVIINSVGTITGITASANGGAGGNQVVANSPGSYNESEGPGGGGGGGYIAVSNGSITQSANGGNNGTTNSSMLTEFPPNGATRGGAGTTGQLITNDTILPVNASICSGNTATLTATIYGPIPATINWYSTLTGGTAIATGTSFTTPVLTSTTTYYVGFCPGTYRYPVTVTVTPGPTITVGPASVCAGSSTTLTAGGGTSYTWSAGATPTGTNTASVSPSSTTTYTVTGTTGGCSSTAVATVTVTPAPTVTASASGICTGQTANLTATGATSYTWSAGATPTGTGTATASPGSTTTYTVTGTSSGCTATDTVLVTVSPLPTVTVSATPICSGQTSSLSASGASSYTWSAGVVATGTSTADASPASTTSYTVTGTNGSCSASAVFTVTVTPTPSVTVTSANICPGQTANLVASGATSYSWSAGATATGTNTAEASPLVTTSYTVTGTSSGCSATAVATVTIGGTADATITSTSPVCVTAAPFNMTAAQTGGAWSGTGITNSTTGTFDPSAAGAGTFLITYAITGACSATDTAYVTVMNTLNSTINNVLPVCLGSLPFNFSAATSGGSWSGTGITNTAAGTFTASSAGVGSHVITYTIPGSCGSTDTTVIIVNPNSDATITQPSTQCTGNNPITLSAVSSGGNWSGTGVTSATAGTFDPDVAGPGTHVITYSISGSCGSSDTVSITVNSPLNATINTVPSLCVGDAPVTLSAATSGGLWSGQGITDSVAGVFDPAIAGIGTHVVAYNLSGICPSNDTLLLNVTPPADLTITAVLPMCPGSPAINLVSATSGGSWSGTGITNSINGTFDPAVAGIGTHTVVYTLPGGCGGVDSATVSVVAPVVASIATITPVCATAAAFNLSGSPAGGTWSGTGITNTSTGTFDPLTAGAGTHTVFYQISGGCGDTAQASVVVNASSYPSVTPSVTTGCATLCVQFNEAASSSCVSMTYDFGDGNTSALTSPSHCYTAPGLYTVTVSCTNANGCVGTTNYTDLITVNAVPVAGFTVSPAGVISSNTSADFNNTSSGGGISFWEFGDTMSSSNTSSIANPSHLYLNEGNYCITLIEVSAAGCADTTSDCIIVANDATLNVPNVFTPNGDGNNDVFFFNTTSVSSLTCAVYDRWGLKLAQWDTVNGGWDGKTTSGAPAPDGVYYYILKATGTNGKVFEDQGFVQLLNK
jgi:gliding motility-associated-like protein